MSEMEVKRIGDSVIFNGDCLEALPQLQSESIHLSFFDPPFNQGKDYIRFNDRQESRQYWDWIEQVLKLIYGKSSEGASLYFMQREKNTEEVLNVVKKSGWNFQNLIIWKKATSAVPSRFRFGKQYQVIAFATKGLKPRVFNRLRANVPTPRSYKKEREHGIYLTDVWDDIRELTSGYFAGDEAFRSPKGDRIHTQQSPVALLLRILLSSTLPGDTVLDPTAGTGVLSIVASQLGRKSISIENDRTYFELINQRLSKLRKADSIEKLRSYYDTTENIDQIWNRVF